VTGIFEDDANVRPVKKVKQPKAAKSTKPKRSMASKILDKVEDKGILVAAASAKDGVSYEDVDVMPGKRTKAVKAKAESGKLVPPINYVSDDHGSV